MSYVYLTKTQALSPKLQALVGRSVYGPMVSSIPFLCPRECRGDVSDSLCGEIAKVVTYCTYMPGEVIRYSNSYGVGSGMATNDSSVFKHKYSIKPRCALYIVDTGVVFLRRLKDVKILHK